MRKQCRENKQDPCEIWELFSPWNQVNLILENQVNPFIGPKDSTPGQKTKLNFEMLKFWTLKISKFQKFKAKQFKIFRS